MQEQSGEKMMPRLLVLQAGLGRAPSAVDDANVGYLASNSAHFPGTHASMTTTLT